MSVHSERLEHLEKEVRALRIQVKAQHRAVGLLIAKLMCTIGPDAEHKFLAIIDKAEKEAAEVFDA